MSDTATAVDDGESPAPAPPPVTAGDPPAPAPADPAPAPPGAEPAPVEAGDWRAAIRDEKLRAAAADYQSPEEILKRVTTLRTKMNELTGRTVVPGDQATDEERAAYRKAVGIPDAADGYGLAVPEAVAPALQNVENAKEGLGLVAGKFHQLGLSKAQAEGVMELYWSALGEASQTSEATNEARIDELQGQMRQKYGEAWPKEEAFALKAMSTFADAGMNDFMAKAQVDGVPANQHPVWIEFAARVGRAMAEDSAHGTMSDVELKSSNERLDELTAGIHTAMAKGDRTTANRLSAERDSLQASLIGDRPVDFTGSPHSG